VTEPGTETPVETGTYVYAVGRHLDEQAMAELEGVGAAPVRVIAHRDLNAVVSTVDLAEFGESALRKNLENLSWVEKTARRHDEVVRRAAAITTALAPFRLVTIYRSDAAARDRIEELYDELVIVLERIDRRSEWSVKIFDRQEPIQSAQSGQSAQSATSGATPAAESTGSGVAYLERRRAEIRQRREAAGDKLAQADQLFWELVPAAAATRRLPPQDQRLTGHQAPMLMNATLLVDDDRSTAFFEMVATLRSKYPSLDIEVNGPWPPYSFAVLDKP